MGRAFHSYPFTEWIVNNERLLMVADNSKKILAFIIVRPKGDEASVDLFCYDKRSKVQDLKEDLLEKAESSIDTNKITIFLPKTDSLLPFFKKQGYEIFDEVKDLYGNKKDAYLLVKNLHEAKKVRKVKKEKKVSTKKASKDIVEEVLDEKSHIDDNLEKLDAYLDF